MEYTAPVFNYVRVDYIEELAPVEVETDDGINSSASANMQAVRVDPPEAPPPDPDRYAGFDIPNYWIWDGPMSDCESTGDWEAYISSFTGGPSKYTGGLQIWIENWKKHGGLEFAPAPYLATKEQQMWIAELTLRDPQGNGPYAWQCTKKEGLKNSDFDLRPLRPYEPPVAISVNEEAILMRGAMVLKQRNSGLITISGAR